MGGRRGVSPLREGTGGNVPPGRLRGWIPSCCAPQGKKLEFNAVIPLRNVQVKFILVYCSRHLRP